MPKRAPTIIDVAEAAGVSTATVSRVINGGEPVKPRTREVVREAIATLGYRRNSVARGLVTGQTGVIGVLIPDLLGPLYGQMARGIEEVLVPLGIHPVIVSDNRDPDEERAATELLLERQVDALIIIGSYLSDLELSHIVGDLPVVLVQREKPPLDVRYDTFQLKNEGGLAEAIDHLIQMGHQRIAHISGPRYDGKQRARFFQEELKRRDLVHDLVFTSDGTEAGGFSAAQAVTAKRDITAVVCINDRTALGFYHGLNMQGLHIPKDISVIGFDDLPWSAYLNPPLTTLHQPARAMGQAAAKRLLEQLETPSAPRRVTFPARLIQRASVQNMNEKEVAQL